jgi:hypothetical protein
MPKSMPTPNLGRWSYSRRECVFRTKLRYAPRQESGAAASQFGHECGERIAIAPGTRLRCGASNECEVNGERVVIKCARKDTTKVGVSYNMLTKLDAVLGAFEEPNGSYRVLRLSAQRCATPMQQAPTASRGPSSGKVGMVNRAVFEQEGTLVRVVRI